FFLLSRRICCVQSGRFESSLSNFASCQKNRQSEYIRPAGFLYFSLSFFPALLAQSFMRLYCNNTFLHVMLIFFFLFFLSGQKVHNQEEQSPSVRRREKSGLCRRFWLPGNCCFRRNRCRYFRNCFLHHRNPHHRNRFLCFLCFRWCRNRRPRFLCFRCYRNRCPGLPEPPEPVHRHTGYEMRWNLLSDWNHFLPPR